MSNDPAGKKYMGLACNKPTAAESNNPADYAWSLIKGDKGDQGIPGLQGFLRVGNHAVGIYHRKHRCLRLRRVRYIQHVQVLHAAVYRRTEFTPVRQGGLCRDAARDHQAAVLRVLQVTTTPLRMTRATITAT